jgi:hypothetical protein
MSEVTAREGSGTRRGQVLSGLIGLILGAVLTAVVLMTTMPEGMSVISGVIGLVLGVVLTAVLVMKFMPGMMIKTHRSRLGLEETVSRLESAIQDQGWVHSGTRNMNESLSKHGTDFEPGVRLVALCHPDYAQSVLSTDREEKRLRLSYSSA